ncbi:MAG TPA: hypothetical protein K8V47_04780 [Candidatus Amulumruptor caecigallinarius]|uniref:Uncharacterized protein n=1 Tax=Candidatus Amulumruptor caecigallinarius TaxID=2109911 RepID=A0A921E8C5_9BACT|nr:hypothetical protein [Candidatus Amulumruptor caecigallinarius]
MALLQNIKVRLTAAILFMAYACTYGCYATGVIRFDRIIAASICGDSISQNAMLDSLRPAVDAMARIGILENDDLDGLKKYAEGRAFRFFAPDIDARLDYDKFAARIDSTIHAVTSLLPEISVPKHVYGIITPYNQSVMNVDSVMLIGLNHYLGADYDAYSYFEPYLRRQKDSRKAAYHIAESLVQQRYPYLADSTATALNYMIHDGAVTAALMAAVPEASLADAGGWTPEELLWLEQHESELWEAMKAKKMLQTSDPKTLSQLFAPSPGTLIFENHAPGRTGRYIGYRMVRSYLDSDPSADISDLLTPTGYMDDASEISGCYHPASM